MNNKEVYLINSFVKLNNGKSFESYITDVLDEDSQYNMNYKTIILDIGLFQLKVIESKNDIELNFIYNTKDIYINSDSLIKFLINRIFLSNISFDNDSTQKLFVNKYVG